MCDIPCPTVGERRPRHRRQTLRQISLWQMCQSSGMVKAIPHNSKCRYGERGAADAKPKAQIILDAAKVSAASGGNSEPKQGQRSQSARGFCPRSTMRVPQLDIIEHFGNADAVPQLPERCLSRKAGIVRCCLKTAPYRARYHVYQTEKRPVEQPALWPPQRKKHATAQLYYPCTTSAQQQK